LRGSPGLLLLQLLRLHSALRLSCGPCLFLHLLLLCLHSASGLGCRLSLFLQLSLHTALRLSCRPGLFLCLLLLGLHSVLGIGGSFCLLLSQLLLHFALRFSSGPGTFHHLSLSLTLGFGCSRGLSLQPLRLANLGLGLLWLGVHSVLGIGGSFRLLLFQLLLHFALRFSGGPGTFHYLSLSLTLGFSSSRGLSLQPLRLANLWLDWLGLLWLSDLRSPQRLSQHLVPRLSGGLCLVRSSLLGLLNLRLHFFLRFNCGSRGLLSQTVLLGYHVCPLLGKTGRWIGVTGGLPGNSGRAFRIRHGKTAPTAWIAGAGGHD